MPSAPIRVLIADDERLARRGLRQLLADELDVTIVAECENGKQTLATLRSHDIDLLFLDVKMPLGDGFDVLATIPPPARPVVVFVTAFAQHARHAFDAQALDYVLKPLEQPRVKAAVARAREQIRLRRLSRYDERLEELLTRPSPRVRHEESDEVTVSAKRVPADLASRVGPSRRLSVRSRDGVRLLAEERIDWVEAVGYYARLRIGREALLLRESLDALERRLDPSRFVRIHRSALVNVERIVAVQPYSHGRGVVILNDGTRLILSRTRRAAVGATIGWPVSRSYARPETDPGANLIGEDEPPTDAA